MTRAPVPMVALRLLAMLACAVVLSGCITLLPKSKAAQLYRFGDELGSVQAPGASTNPARAVAVFRTIGSFQSEASDDRMLTVTNGKAGYIAESRWVAPAEVLFEQAVDQGFDVSPIRLIARGQQGRSAYALRLDVRNFETRYVSGSNAAPVIVVRLRAALSRSDQSIVGEQIFEAQVPASENRVGQIVAAYDKAVAEVIGKLIVWTEANAV